MSTEAAVAEPEVKAPPTPDPAQSIPEGAIPPQGVPSITLPSSIAEIVKKGQTDLPMPGKIKGKDKKETAKPDEKKAEPAKEEKKEPEPKPAETKTPEPAKEKPKTAEENLAEQRKLIGLEKEARQKAEQQIAELQKQVETFKSNPIPEDVRKQIEEKDKQLAEFRSITRQANLQRDPEFQQKFDQGIRTKMQQMADIAISVGIDKTEVVQNVNAWNQSAFNEWIEKMSPLQQSQFGAAMSSAVDLDRQRQQELADADKNWERISKEREQQAKDQQAQWISDLKKDAEAVVSEFFKDERLAKDPELRTAVETAVMKAAGIHEESWSRRDVLQQVGANAAMAKVINAQMAENQKLKEDLAERDKKIAEQDAFIEKHSGSVPRPGSPAGDKSDNGKYVPPWQRIQVRV